MAADGEQYRVRELLLDKLCLKSPIRFNRRHHLLRGYVGAAAYPGSLLLQVNTNACHPSNFFNGLTDRPYTAASGHSFNVKDHVEILIGNCNGNTDGSDCEQYEQGSHSQP